MPYQPCSWPVAENDWKISRANAVCGGCGCSLQAGEMLFSVLCHAATDDKNAQTGLNRLDFCVKCQETRDKSADVYFWRSVVQSPDKKREKRVETVDSEQVFELFKVLENEKDPRKTGFRYILGLMLARKKWLLPEARKRADDGTEVQVYREKKGGQLHEVREPLLNTEELAGIADELGALLGFSTPAGRAQNPAGPERGQVAADSGIQESETSEAKGQP